MALAKKQKSGNGVEHKDEGHVQRDKLRVGGSTMSP